MRTCSGGGGRDGGDRAARCSPDCERGRAARACSRCEPLCAHSERARRRPTKYRSHVAPSLLCCAVLKLQFCGKKARRRAKNNEKSNCERSRDRKLCYAPTTLDERRPPRALFCASAAVKERASDRSGAIKQMASRRKNQNVEAKTRNHKRQLPPLAHKNRDERPTARRRVCGQRYKLSTNFDVQKAAGERPTLTCCSCLRWSLPLRPLRSSGALAAAVAVSGGGRRRVKHQKAACSRVLA